MEAVLLSPEEVRASVPMSAAIDAVRAAFASLAAGDFEMPTRTALRDGQFLVMSAHHRPTASAMIKTLSLNFAGRLPAIIGTVVWTDLERTGQVVADAATVTALRTGAASGVATDLLAPPSASTCTIIGAGGQAADQVRAVNVVRPLTELTIVDRALERAEALAAALSDELDAVKIGTSDDATEAVAGRDIVCCATTSTQPLFDAGSLSEQVHVNAIGAFRPSMRELPDELLATATVVVDEKEAALEESGEIIHAIEAGMLTSGDLTELGHALAEPGPRSGRTAFKSVGVAAQDWAVAHLLALLHLSS